MANLISVNVLKYGNIEFGTTLADAKTMVLSTEHIIYGTNKETDTGVDVTTATAATDAVTTGADHGITSGEYVRIGKVGDSVGAFDIASADYTPGKIFKVQKTGATGLFLHGSEAHYDANTKQDITTNGSGLTLDVVRVQGKILYADPSLGSGTPIEIITVEPCVNVADGFGVSAKSRQLIPVEVNRKNGVAYDAATISEINLMINLERVILSYEGLAVPYSDSIASADDWAVWYDASNTNFAGMDSPFVDVLEVETSLDGHMTSFIDHAGGKSAFVNALALVVNGQKVVFPDQSASAVVRLKNIASANEMAATTAFGWGSVSANDTIVKLKRGLGKGGDDYLVVDHTAAQLIALTEEAMTT